MRMVLMALALGLALQARAMEPSPPATLTFSVFFGDSASIDFMPLIAQARSGRARPILPQVAIDVIKARLAESPEITTLASTTVIPASPSAFNRVEISNTVFSGTVSLFSGAAGPMVRLNGALSYAPNVKIQFAAFLDGATSILPGGRGETDGQVGLLLVSLCSVADDHSGAANPPTP